MKIYVIDFETYFDKEYSLKKMTTEAYIRDPRFQVHLMAVKDVYEGKNYVIDDDDLRGWCSHQDWGNTILLAHHAHFDGFILGHHYGVHPAMWLDTLCMARLLVGSHLSVSLGSAAERFGLGEKTVPYGLFMGVRSEHLDGNQWSNLAAGATQDTELTWKLFRELEKNFPEEEYHVVDTTIRMFTEPSIIGDADAFSEVAEDEREKKRALLAQLGVTEKDLRSPSKFAALLREQGVEPEYKEGAKGPIYCFAKTDTFMKELEFHENNTVSSLVSARLQCRSTLNESRGDRLAAMAGRGPLPVYLTYAGAHTSRWSGGDSVNFQNFPRSGLLRKALSAPKGYMLAVADLSQIECRILNFAAGQQDIVDAFREGRDLYCEMASKIFGREVTKKDDPVERHLGKVVELGCGYGMGWKKLRATCKAGALGGRPIELSEQEAKNAIDVYRYSHQAVTSLWGKGQEMLGLMSRMSEGKVTKFGILKIAKGKIILPNDIPLFYDLAWKAGFRRKIKGGDVAIWGGGLIENVVQALARVVMSQAMCRIADKGYKIVMTTHDELVMLVHEDTAQAGLDDCIAEMVKEPPWLKGIPLAAEGFVSKTYDK